MMLIALGVLACKKNRNNNFPDPPPDTPQPVLLKDFTVNNLPSPYYHFKYNEKNEVSFASFGSGLLMYDVLYSNGKIAEMRSNTAVNKDTLRYSYNKDGLPDMVRYINETGTFRYCSFSYHNGRLLTAQWKLETAGGLALERTLNFAYYEDGNVAKISDLKHAVNGRPESSNTSEFSQYDDKVNAGGFALLHDDGNSDHLLLYLQVMLQKNNPGKLLFSNTALNYQVDYTYSYNEKKLPLTRRGVVTMLGGPRDGEQFISNSSYSYYP
ncbi:MAG: hypothetical protein ACTHMC_14225 [Pseudobacter sp.]|uniref:hypothetical protein n=1 Tax=Pseudobacter sp. TaxID=2045420 RepID=UPI003F7D8B63